jgi:hypothetical protein
MIGAELVSGFIACRVGRDGLRISVGIVGRAIRKWCVEFGMDWSCKLFQLVLSPGAPIFK